MPSDYEAQRLTRLRENERALSELGIPIRVDGGATKARKRQRKTALNARKRRIGHQEDGLTKATTRRSSRRLRGFGTDTTPLGEDENGVKPPKSSDEGEHSTDEEQEEQSLIERWKLSMEASKGDEGSVEDGNRRRLFLVPTGVPGVNDHTLDEPVKSCDDSHLWGFCEGLLTRIFVNIRPGDILLMTSSGGGAFNRIARVKEKRIVSKSEADQFWSRMSFSMGGTSKSNVGFPLLVPIDKPKSIDWPKKDVMKLLGYTDHLQSSRWIKKEKLLTSSGRLVYQRCLSTLGIDETFSKEELKIADHVTISPTAGLGKNLNAKSMTATAA